MKKLFLVLVAAVFFVSAQVYGAPYSDPNKTKMIITVTTSNIGEIVKIIGGDKVDVNILLKPLTCPSNIDITPEMAEKAKKSNLILRHKWEKWLGKLKIEAGDRGKLYKEIETEGNWMIPHIHIRAAEEIRDLLTRLDIENSEYFENNYTDYAYNVNFSAKDIQKELGDKAYGVKVICNDKIKDFLESCGFEVVAEYGKQEDITVKKMAYLISEGKKHNVKVIIDNLQAGPATGRELAENLGAKRTVISNFILGKSYINTLRDNILKLKKVLE